MIGTLITPTIASTALAREAFWRSSMEACKAIKPRYKNNRINSEVRRASHTHHVPHMGLPHSEPVTKVKKVKEAPMTAEAEATLSATFIFQINPIAAETAITT